MGKVYSKDEVIKMVEEAKSDMKNFYKKDFINYSGVTSDKKSYYTEIIAEWLLDNFYLFDNIKMISRESSYKVDSHDGEIKNKNSNREEEKIAMELFNISQKEGKKFYIIGKILDYQTPLKNKQGDEAGKIDLLAYNKDSDTGILRILELKKADSDETMLRCVLEAYTYLRIVDKAKLLKDFDLPEDTIVKACPFVFFDGAQYKEIQEGRKYLKELMKNLDVEPIYLKGEGGEYKAVK